MVGSADPVQNRCRPPLGSISEGLHLTLIASVLEAAKVGNMRRMCSYGNRVSADSRLLGVRHGCQRHLPPPRMSTLSPAA